MSRAIAEIEPVIAAVLAECVPEVPEALTGRIAVVDGTLAPCWSWAPAPELLTGVPNADDRAGGRQCV